MSAATATRRHFLATSAGALAARSLTAAPTFTVPADAVTGPMVGHISDHHALLWIRPPRPGPVEVVVQPTAGGTPIKVTGTAEEAGDLCLALRIPGLTPATDYSYRFLGADGTRLGEGSFRTWPSPERPARVSIALGSCAFTEPSPVWTRMEATGCEALVLLGDTPYIDKYDLAVARQRHREFLHIPELRPLLARRPVWGTWDDHDFGLNAHLGDSDPRGKRLTRQAFLEYRALDSPGDVNGGIYTRFRAGPLEVWLLDPRWFANTEPSPVDPAKPSCFGATQWNWLQRTLQASTAPFKLLAMGEIWQDKTNSEPDDLGTFPHEREALFDFIRDQQITGVMLCGGDIHCSRHLILKNRVGYDLHEFVTSPIHASTIPSLNVPHPALVWGRPEPRSFLRLTADTTVPTPTCSATFLNANGTTLHEVSLTTPTA